MKPKIFIACDTNKESEVKNYFQTKTNKLDGYKFGLEFFYQKMAVNLFQR